MTCIVGLEHDGIVTIGGDSAGVAGYSLTVRADTKVFATGPYVMGFTTSFRMGQLLRYSLSIGAPDTWDVDRFMATTFVNAVRACLTAGGYTKIDSGRESAGTFLVGIAGRLYAIESDFQIARSTNGYDAVGCGGELALGALHGTDEDALAHLLEQDDLPVSVSARRRLTGALAAAAHHSAGVVAPFAFVSTGHAD